MPEGKDSRIDAVRAGHMLIDELKNPDMNPSICWYLIAKGADVHLKTRDGYKKTALMLAAWRRDRRLVKALLERGADVHAVDAVGMTALAYAACENDAGIVSDILDEGAKVDAVNNRRITPLMHAVYHGCPDVVRMLAHRGADVDARDDMGRTALSRMMMGESYREQVLDALLDSGADINARDDMGRTPLIRAVIFCEIKIVHDLLVRNADIDAQDYEGKTALDFGAAWPGWRLFDKLETERERRRVAGIKAAAERGTTRTRKIHRPKMG
ncbi:MAG: ankyrin repeat domain-containing protein [Alphaproteobacteria bacterium]|nr:ankyrin repeat domain-containing protein [Alphaproteobacteria bacterium]